MILICIYIIKGLPRSRKLTHPSPHIVNTLTLCVCVCLFRMLKIHSQQLSSIQYCITNYNHQFFFFSFFHFEFGSFTYNHCFSPLQQLLRAQIILSFFFFYFIYLFNFRLRWVFVAALRLFSSCSERGLLLAVVHRLLIAVASLVAEHGLQACMLQQLWHVGSVVVAHRLQSTGSVVVAHRLSCSAACGIFPDQGSNPCPLRWQVDSQPLLHQGSPYSHKFLYLFFY